MKEKITVRSICNTKSPIVTITVVSVTKEVVAELLPPISGFEKYKFYVHKTIPTNLEMGRGKYTVTDPITGIAIASGNTRKEAISTAQMKLQGLGLKDFEVWLNKWCGFLDITRSK